MKIDITEATFDDKPVLSHMLEFCAYELSPYDDADLNLHGKYGYNYLDLYWREQGRHAFLVRVDNQLAGFAMVNNHHYTPDAEFSMAEFFIMRRYQNKGVGKAVAFYIFAHFSGTWEIRQLRRHTQAQDFWRKVISEFAGKNFREFDGYGEWKGPIQVFCSNRL